MSDTNSFRATKINVVILLKQLRLGLRGVKTNEKANMHNQHWQSLQLAAKIIRITCSNPSVFSHVFP